MMQNNPIIICGSGNSITEGLKYDIMDYLQTHITIGLNRWYQHAFEPTFTTFVDWQFYRDNLEALEKQGLIIGKYDPQIKYCKYGKGQPAVNIQKQNTILLPKHNTYYGKDSWRIWERTCLNCRHKFTDDFREPKPVQCPECGRKTIQKFGFYSGHLCGMFALTLAIALGFTEIYLLGFDCCEVDGKTHFFQDDVDLEKKNIDGQKEYHGVGSLTHTNGKKEYKTSTYNDVSNLNELWYKPYHQVLHEVNIVNVSIPSKIRIFQKMDMIKFLEKIGKGNINQDEIRKEIRAFVDEKTKKQCG